MVASYQPPCGYALLFAFWRGTGLTWRQDSVDRHILFDRTTCQRFPNGCYIVAISTYCGEKLKQKALAFGAAFVVAAIGSYWYLSPYLTLNHMRTAIKERDADAFNDYVDYPKLRESLKGEMSVRLADVTEKARSGNSFEQAGAALGSMLGMAVMDHMVDALMRPEMVMRAMERGAFDHEKRHRSDQPAPVDAPRERPTWHTERKSVDKLLVYAAKDGEDASENTGFLLQREGFASWKLTAIRFPALK
ncbi:DUF2939 domain-containing protein [Pseudoduganella sp. UC29_106]|uniref:DUF2939 domain-containing protein n=1 Tax=Pseudoduganella sp. UC29_106 TaxID=3374553 RepID=UPI003757449F